jgi:PTS system cellobiose-specific IIC component
MKQQSWVEGKLLPGLNRFFNTRIIRSITGGFLATMPLVLIGAFLQIIAYIAEVLSMGIKSDIISNLSILANSTFGLIGIFFAFHIASENAKLNKVNPPVAGFLAIALYFLMLRPAFQSIDMMNSNLVINFSRFGANGMFVSIVTGLFTGEMMGLFARLKWMPQFKGVPEMLRGWFAYLIPGIIILAVGFVVTYVLNIDLYNILGQLLTPIIKVADTYPGMILICSIMAITFALGVHPISVVGVLLPVMLAALQKNADLAATGLAPTVANGFTIFNMGTIFAFCALGGTGATWALNIWMLRSKSKSLKSLGKAALVPTILNINEPLIFGLPIIYNPILAIPFILGFGVLNPVVVRLSMQLGLNAIPFAMVPIPFLPSGIIGFVMNHDWRGIIVTLIILVLDMALWYPFFKIHERRVLAQETAEESTGAQEAAEESSGATKV